MIIFEVYPTPRTCEQEKSELTYTKVYVPYERAEEILRNYNSGQLSYLNHLIQREARRQGEEFTHWLWDLAKIVMHLRNIVELEELSRQYPDRTISVDGCGVMIS